MTKQCQNCVRDFEITSDDLQFYGRFQVPPPTFCPECRLVQRLAFRNERSLYKRPCALCGKEKILMYPAGSAFTVYCKECWWSDGWDSKTYGQEYDFSKPFFEQFAKLLHAVPRPGIVQQGTNPGSDYANRVTDNRNCYLVFGSSRTEHCSYGVWLNDSQECVDCYDVQKSQRCYECIDCFQCYNCVLCQESEGCRNSWFLLNCRNLDSCFGCVNLRNKSFCIFNKEYSKEEYQRIISSYRCGDITALKEIADKFEAFKKQFIVPSLVVHHSTDVSGNWIEGSKNAVHSFTMRNVEEARYCFSVFDAKDVMDFSYWGNGSERIYHTANVGNQCANVRFSNECWNQAIDVEYCFNCHSSRDLFGCVGLRNAQYCILNRQYTKGEYVELVTKIKEHMAAMPYVDVAGASYGYGEFLPPCFSPHAYNETVAQEFFPLTKEEALQKGFLWKEQEPRDYQITVSPEKLPPDIQNAPDSITAEVVGCANSSPDAPVTSVWGRGPDLKASGCTTAFKVTPDELSLYRSMNVPLPWLCPNCRHYARLGKRNPLHLWERTCQCKGAQGANGNTASHFHGAAPCPNKFETTYAPERPEIVYCETCYNTEVA